MRIRAILSLNPEDVILAVGVGNAREDKEEIRESIEVLKCQDRSFLGFDLDEGRYDPFCSSADGSDDVELNREVRSTWEDETCQGREICVVLINEVFEELDSRFCDS